MKKGAAPESEKGQRGDVEMKNFHVTTENYNL